MSARLFLRAEMTVRFVDYAMCFISHQILRSPETKTLVFAVLDESTVIPHEQYADTITEMFKIIHLQQMDNNIEEIKKITKNMDTLQSYIKMACVTDFSRTYSNAVR